MFLRVSAYEVTLQVYLPEVSEEEKVDAKAFLAVFSIPDKNLLWSSDKITDVFAKQLFESKDLSDIGIEHTIPVVAQRGVIELPLVFSETNIQIKHPIPDNLLVKGSIDINGELKTFESLIKPVPLAVYASQADSVSDDFLLKNQVIQDLDKRIINLTKEREQQDSFIRDIVQAQATLHERILELMARINDLEPQLNNDPRIDLQQTVTLRPKGYLRTSVVLPDSLQNAVFIGGNEPFDGPGDSAYVIWSSHPEIVSVNLGRYVDDIDAGIQTLTIMAEGILGEARIYLERLDRLSDEELPANFITVNVDTPGLGNSDKGYAYFSRDTEPYSITYPEWGGEFGGDNPQNSVFGRSATYQSVVAANGGEHFKMINVVFTTADADADYEDGSRAQYLTKMNDLLEKTYDVSLPHISPQEHWVQSSMGLSTLDLANDSGIVVVPIPRKMEEMELELFKREYRTKTYNTRLSHSNEADLSGNTLSLEINRNNGWEVWSPRKINEVFGTNLQLKVDNSTTQVIYAQNPFPGGEGFKSSEEEIQAFNEFLDSDDIWATVGDIPDDHIVKKRLMTAPGSYYIYFVHSFDDTPEGSFHVMELELDVQSGPFFLTRPTALENTLKSYADEAIESLGLDGTIYQYWWLPSVKHSEYNVYLKSWAFGGAVVSSGAWIMDGYSTERGKIDRISSLTLHEMGHTILKLPDHYASTGSNHSDAVAGRTPSIHDVMSSQSRFADHVMPSKFSRGWFEAEDIAVFNPKSIPIEQAFESFTKTYKLANLNDANPNLEGDLLAGLEIRLADGNNLTVEYRGPNRNGFGLFPFHSTVVTDYFDYNDSFRKKTSVVNPAEYFKIFETWSNLGPGFNTLAQVTAGSPQRELMLAPSDNDTHWVGLSPGNIGRPAAGVTDVDARNFVESNAYTVDKIWKDYSGHGELKHDGPFLVPSVLGQELKLDNVSNNDLLEEMEILPTANYNDEYGEITIKYTRASLANQANQGPDPSIRPWTGNYQSPDIWVENAWNMEDPELYNLPHKDLPNEVKVRVHNNFGLPIKNVRVELFVKDYNATSGSSDTWSSLGMHTIDQIEARSNFVETWSGGETRGVFSTGTEIDGKYHKCLRVVVKRWSGSYTIEGQAMEFAESGRALENNEAQSNYSWLESTSSSPANIAVVPVTITNHYDEMKEFEVFARPSRSFFQVFNPEPIAVLRPEEERQIMIGVQYRKDIRDNIKITDPYNNAYVSISAIIKNAFPGEFGEEDGHPLDSDEGGGSVKVFGGLKTFIDIDERSKLLNGFVRIAGNRGNVQKGRLHVLVINENESIDKTLISEVTPDGAFQLIGADFTKKLVCTFKPEAFSDLGYAFLTVPAAQN